MGFVAAFDKSIFYNQENRYCVFRLKTADKMVPPDARSSLKYRDHLIRFVAVGFDLPRDDTVKMELYGRSVDKTPEAAKLRYLKQLCTKCVTRRCQFNYGGECRFPLVHERMPRLTAADDCKEYGCRAESTNG